MCIFFFRTFRRLQAVNYKDDLLNQIYLHIIRIFVFPFNPLCFLYIPFWNDNSHSIYSYFYIYRIFTKICNTTFEMFLKIVFSFIKFWKLHFTFQKTKMTWDVVYRYISGSQQTAIWHHDKNQRQTLQIIFFFTDEIHFGGHYNFRLSF